MKKKFILLLILSAQSCKDISTNSTLSTPLTVDTKQINAKFDAQIKTWLYKTPINADFFKIIINNDKSYIDSAANIHLHYGSFLKSPYKGDILNAGNLKIIQFDSLSYLWIDIDFFDKFFWDNSNLTIKDSQTISSNIDWYFESIIRPMDLILPYPCLPYADTAENCYINSQRYLRASNNIGHTLDISEYDQFEQLNMLFKANTYYHGKDKLDKVEAIISLLQEARIEKYQHQMGGVNYIKIEPNVSFLAETGFDCYLHKEVDTARLKIRGVDFWPMRAYYLKEILVNKTVKKQANGHNINYDYYGGYTTVIDSFKILKQYLIEHKPSFLYYKLTGAPPHGWYNYFQAYYIKYDEKEIPIIDKVELICPQRVYNYWCFSSGFCDDVGTNTYKSAAYAYWRNK
jgi:hypothetical protein